MRGCGRKLYNEGLHEIDSSPNNMIIIKSRTVKLAGHVAYMEMRVIHYSFWWKKLEVKKLLRRTRYGLKDNVMVDLEDG
jgi:hypothetical protein